VTALLHAATVTHALRTTRLNPSVPALVRDWLTTLLRNRDLPADTAILVACELATNAILYADPPLQVTAAFGMDEMTLTVTDRVPPAPRLSPLPDDEHGLGLGIVAALCRQVDEHTADGAHTVTALIHLGDPR